MGDLVSRTVKAAMIVSATLLVSACGGGDSADDAAANMLDANLMLEEPANDQSAMEAAANATDIAPVTNNQSTEDGNVLGETKGGDTGGNTIENNVSGM